MPDGMTQRASVVFTSWKEIASYLGKGVRTVQRWEAQFGLPVQRPNAHAKGIVRATREELDRWIATRWSLRSGGFELPDGLAEIRPNLEDRPTNAGIQAMEELRMQNRALVVGLRASLERLAHNCQNLASNMQLGCESPGLPSSSVITESQLVPPPLPAHKEAKAD